ncbi:MAG: hypothetical protein QOJ79_564 [Actinomycetota bacterium]|jgi:hypothetical protein|nr:hypothetical protein [Actinomycetota bacterium]
MPTWSVVLDLQRGSRRNALFAAASLRRRRADNAEAQRATLAATRASLLDGAHHEAPHRSSSPDLPEEL